MSTTTARCDRIIALIDDCLADYDAALGSVLGQPVPTTRRPSRRPHLVGSIR
ncbi:MAG TPA: hypothetical protein VGF22_20020 [Acidimicrobiales bacterium]|jgi:hypothetical protein